MTYAIQESKCVKWRHLVGIDQYPPLNIKAIPWFYIDNKTRLHRVCYQLDFRQFHEGISIQLLIYSLQKSISNEMKPEFTEKHNTRFPHIKDVKLLGITIDDKITFDKQVDRQNNI